MSHKRILIVEDEQRVALALGRALQHPRSGGYQVEFSPSADQAVERLEQCKAEQEHFDLVITDLRMPGKRGGMDLIKYVRQTCPGTRTILITAFGSTEVEAQTQQLAAAYLRKPFTLQDFVSTVQGILTQKEEKTSVGQRLLVINEDGLMAISTLLDTLRREVGATSVILSDLMGRTMAQTGEIEEIEQSAASVLLGGSMAAASELIHTLGESSAIDLHYHEGERYDIYAATVQESMLLSLFFDKHTTVSRIGMVWLYVKRAITELVDHLGTAMSSVEAETELGESLADALGDALDRALSF